MPYQAEKDVTLPRRIGERKLPGGQSVELKESVNYVTGAIILEKDLTQAVLTRLENGDDHLSSLLRYVDVAEARAILGKQAQVVASQPVPEEEILHQEERLGGSAGAESSAVGPQFEVGDPPPYEAPPADTQISDSGTAQETSPPSLVDTAAQTVGQGTQEVASEEGAVAEEVAEGSSESEGDANAEVVEEQTKVEATEGASGVQEDGQDQSSDSQEEKTAEEAAKPDKYEGMDLAELKAEAKKTKLSGRSLLKSEDKLRAALREAGK